MLSFVIYAALAIPAAIFFANRYGNIHWPTLWAGVFFMIWVDVSDLIAVYLEGFFS